MEKQEGEISEQFENELRDKFIQVKPNDDFIKTLSDALFSSNRIRLENEIKVLYYIALSLFGLFSGLLLWSIISHIFFPSRSTDKKKK
jgi:hypothetical protein